MTHPNTAFHEQVASGRPLVLAELSPPAGSDPAPWRATARRFAGKVHAVGVCDNRQGARMSALAAAALLASEGVEPIWHVVTRDRNRIALVSDWLGAQALGIHNVLCTTGTHQTLGPFRSARNVFDIDSVQLLQTYSRLASDASIVGEAGLNGGGPFCLGGVASPLADPQEMQLMRLAKKVAAGARFLITQPVFDLERFAAWLEEVRRRGIHQQAAIVAGILPLTCAVRARQLAQARPQPGIPEALLERIAGRPDAAAQRAEGIQVAVETIRKLSAVEGLRGFQVSGDWDPEAALEVLEKSGLGVA